MIDVTAVAFSAGISLDTAASSQSKPRDPQKLAEAAKQFEALMISQMMKAARESNGDGWLSDGDQAGEDTATGLAEEEFAQSMAASGGLGLAKMIVKTMSQAEATAELPHSLAAIPKT